MENIALVIITALISGLLAALVTIWWQRRAEIFASKMRIFETLMSFRYMISSEESVKALNSIDIIFYKNFKHFFNLTLCNSANGGKACSYGLFRHLL